VSTHHSEWRVKSRQPELGADTRVVTVGGVGVQRQVKANEVDVVVEQQLQARAHGVVDCLGCVLPEESVVHEQQLCSQVGRLAKDLA